MTRLSDLHRRLSRLKHRRQRYRWMTGTSALAIALLWALAIAFPIDWYFQQSMDVWQRLFLLTLCGAGVIWAAARYTLPWLGQRESELDLALLVERHEHIDSDLVAALEFEWPEAVDWGSPQLQEAVIRGVEDRGKQLHVMKNLPAGKLKRRLQILTLTVAFWAVVVALVPDYLAVFLDRLLLGSRHYPTQTRIDSITINGREVDLTAWGQKPIRVLHNQPVRFELHASGDLPAAGTANLIAGQSGLRAGVALDAADARPEVYRGELPRLVESARCQITLGDAWTDPVELLATQLPLIDLEAEVVPPDYTSSDGGKAVAVPRGMRQFPVIEGSEVRMTVRSDKLLSHAILTLDDKPFPLARHVSSGASSDIWVLGEEETPLTCVLQPIRFSLQVIDVDEQQLERPIEGAIRIQPDLPPRLAAATRTPHVLPTAKPTIYYRAVDDYAMGRISFGYEIVHAKPKDGDSASAETKTGEIEVYQRAADQPPQRNVEGERPLDLAPLGLVKGDTVKLTVSARDYRGRREGKSASAEPLVFQVTDEQGILASMLESDKQSARELKTMIQRQLGIGEPR